MVCDEHADVVNHVAHRLMAMWSLLVVIIAHLIEEYSTMLLIVTLGCRVAVESSERELGRGEQIYRHGESLQKKLS